MPGEPRNILLVEDHRDTANMMARLLGRAGHRVAVAGSCAEALALVERSRFDLLLSDMELPDGDGCDLVAKVLARQALRAVAVTGRAMPDEVARALAAGFAEVVPKPFHFPQLLAAVEQGGMGPAPAPPAPRALPAPPAT